ncbi:hypothetical protein HMPREF0623_1835 [Pediococcus acidilactici DSM 20284]|uniref:Uncharacterized protein n=1 Tax=Pediococcus acidilactici DSM 20284 TaxID=862514 RepID=E0NIK4_PEDAC|nr:hypothetical protein HMPREF0623_1835 [Pediococcus acidilactici DSM 20284]
MPKCDGATQAVNGSYHPIHSNLTIEKGCFPVLFTFMNFCNKLY